MRRSRTPVGCSEAPLYAVPVFVLSVPLQTTAAVPLPSTGPRRERAVGHEVEGRFSTVVAPGPGAGHPVDRVHRSSVSVGESPTISGAGRSTANGASTSARAMRRSSSSRSTATSWSAYVPCGSSSRARRSAPAVPVHGSAPSSRLSVSIGWAGRFTIRGAHNAAI